MGPGPAPGHAKIKVLKEDQATRPGPGRVTARTRARFAKIGVLKKDKAPSPAWGRVGFRVGVPGHGPGQAGLAPGQNLPSSFVLLPKCEESNDIKVSCLFLLKYYL